MTPKRITVTVDQQIALSGLINLADSVVADSVFVNHAGAFLLDGIDFTVNQTPGSATTQLRLTGAHGPNGSAAAAAGDIVQVSYMTQ